MKAAIVIGSRTNHGGIIREGESRWTIEDKAAHLGGMGHYCPKCEVISKAIPNPHSLNIFGKFLVLAGDKATCGAKFLPNQPLVVVNAKSILNQSIDHNHPANSTTGAPCFDEQFILKTSEGDILPNIPYTIIMKDGDIKRGISDAQGKTERVKTLKSEQLAVYIGWNIEE